MRATPVLESTRRAVAQAQRRGAEILTPVRAVELRAESGYKELNLSDGRALLSRRVVAGTGMTCREHPAEGIKALTGAGLCWGNAVTEPTRAGITVAATTPGCSGPPCPGSGRMLFGSSLRSTAFPIADNLISKRIFP